MYGVLVMDLSWQLRQFLECLMKLIEPFTKRGHHPILELTVPSAVNFLRVARIGVKRCSQHVHMHLARGRSFCFISFLFIWLCNRTVPRSTRILSVRLFVSFHSTFPSASAYIKTNLTYLLCHLLSP